MSENEYNQYRVVGQNHYIDGELVSEGKVLDAEKIPDGILRNFPTKFEPVESSENADVDADAEAEAEVEPVEDVDEDDPTTDEVPESAAEDVRDTDLYAEEVQEEIGEEGTPDVNVDDDAEYTREDLEAMSRNERVQIAKNSDHPDIDGRSSDDDIIAALTDSDSSDE